MRLYHWFVGYVTLRLRGDELPRFLRLCSNKGIFVWDVTYLDWNEMQLKMKKSSVFKIKEFLKKTKTHIAIKEKIGFPFVIYRYRKKTVFFSCVLLSLAMLFMLSRYIWRVDIIGNSYLSEERICDYLEEHKCGIGIKKQSIHTDELKKKLLNDFPEIIWNSVSIHGTTLKITIKEQLKNDDYNSLRQEKMDLISPVDGKIEKIYIRNGSAAVSVGDKVKKNQPLVYGYLPIYNDSGTEIIKYQPVESDADVLVASDVNIYHEIDRVYKRRMYSGKERKYSYYGSFWGNYNVIPYIYGKTQHTSLSRVERLYLLDTIPFPIFRNTTWEREYVFLEEEYNNQELRTLQNTFCKSFIKKMEQKGVQIIDKNVMITYEKSRSVMQGTLSCLYPVKDYAPSKIPQLQKARDDTL